MSPSLQTMGFFMSDINFCNTKEQLNHLGEVVTGKVNGSPSGADIDTSTLPYTGQVRRTLPALEEEYQNDIDNFVQISDQVISDKTAEFDASIANKEAEADAAIDAYRLLSKGPYAAGIELEDRFQYITYNGESYFSVNPPYTTTATTPDTDGNLFAGGYLTQASNQDFGTVSTGIQVKHRRGTQPEIDGFTPAIAEIVINITENEIVLGNGAKQGGIPIPKKENVNLTLDLADAVTNTGLKQGYTLRIKDRGDALFDVVLASSVTPNGYDIVQCTGVATLALSLRIGNGRVHTDACGVVDVDGLQAMNDRLTSAGGMIILDRIITINKTLRLTRNVSMMGAVKQATGIVCDFSSWTGLGLHSVPDFTGIFVEGGSDTDRGARYGRQFRDFFVQGVNNSDKITTGIFMGTADRRLIPNSSSSIGYSIRGGHFSSLNVSQFDIGYNISEVWSSYFEACESLACRVNVEVTGQSVNNKFSACSWNPALSESYTSSTDLTSCCRILNYLNYGPDEDKVGRPEGLTFSQCNMFSANIGFELQGSLHVTLDQCIIDLHADHAVKGVSTAGLTISKCYIASTGGESKGATVLLSDTPTATDLDCKIIHNDIRKIPLAGNESVEAFRCSARKGLLYEGNEHGGYEGQTVCYIDFVEDASIKNNRFQLGVDSYTGQQCIFINSGDKITVDGNISFQGNMILKMTAAKPTNYYIGANYSTEQETLESGSITLPSGQSSVFVDLKHTNSGLGAPGVTQLVSIVTASHDKPLPDFTVEPNGINDRRCTFSSSAPAGTDTNIYWQSRCQ